MINMASSAGVQFTKEKRRWSVRKRFNTEISLKDYSLPYPECHGLFTDCPKEMPDTPPKKCKICMKARQL